jgi:single-stranded-DNA-specific exonuclease
LRAVAFSRADWAEPIACLQRPFSISFAPCINRFRGTESVELQLIDWQPDATAPLSGPTGAQSV